MAETPTVYEATAKKPGLSSGAIWGIVAGSTGAVVIAVVVALVVVLLKPNSSSGSGTGSASSSGFDTSKLPIAGRLYYICAENASPTGNQLDGAPGALIVASSNNTSVTQKWSFTLLQVIGNNRAIYTILGQSASTYVAFDYSTTDLLNAVGQTASQKWIVTVLDGSSTFGNGTIYSIAPGDGTNQGLTSTGSGNVCALTTYTGSTAQKFSTISIL